MCVVYFSTFSVNSSLGDCVVGKRFCGFVGFFASCGGAAGFGGCVAGDGGGTSGCGVSFLGSSSWVSLQQFPEPPDPQSSSRFLVWSFVNLHALMRLKTHSIAPF